MKESGGFLTAPARVFGLTLNKSPGIHTSWRTSGEARSWGGSIEGLKSPKFSAGDPDNGSRASGD